MAFVREKGFTLLELMLVIALLAILAAIAMPSYKNFIDNQKIRSVLNEWQSSFYFAQKEAMRTKMPVILCGSTDGKTCNKKPASSDFSSGWVVLSDSKVLQESVQLDPRIKVTTTGNQFSTNGIVFLSTGRIKNHASGSVTIEIVEISGGKNSAVPDKTLTISSAGRLIGEKR